MTNTTAFQILIISAKRFARNTGRARLGALSVCLALFIALLPVQSAFAANSAAPLQAQTLIPVLAHTGGNGNAYFSAPLSRGVYIDGQSAVVSGTTGEVWIDVSYNNFTAPVTSFTMTSTGSIIWSAYRDGVQCQWGTANGNGTPLAYQLTSCASGAGTFKMAMTAYPGSSIDGLFLTAPDPTPTPTATRTATVIPSLTPTSTATNTPVPPTLTPTFTATNTPVTPTATNTPVPPTATPVPVVVGLTSSGFSATEGDGVATISVNLGSAAASPVTVNYSTAGITALPNVRFTPVSGTLTFQPGETHNTFDIPLIDNLVREGAQTVLIQLSSPSANASLAIGAASLTIVDNETQTSVSGVVSGPAVHFVYPLALGNATIDIAGVGQAATVSVSNTPGVLPDAPQGLTVLGGVYDVSLAANNAPVSFTQATVCLPYSEEYVAQIGAVETAIGLFHYNGTQWENITTSRDTTNNVLCGVTSSFSPFMIAGSASADANAQIDVYGSALQIITEPIVFGDVTLNGVAQTSNGVTLPWNAKDPTGTGAGWHVTIVAADFIGPDNRHIPVNGFTVNLIDGDVHTVYGSTQPVSMLAGPAILGAIPQILLRANPGTGLGHYTLQPTFSLVVPAETYAGEYTSVVTVAIVAGP